MSAAETPGGALTRPGPARTVPARASAESSPRAVPERTGDRLRGRRVLLVDLTPDGPTSYPADSYAADVAGHLAERGSDVTVLRTRRSDARGRGSTGPVRRIWRALADCVRTGLVGRRLDADLVVAVTPPAGGAAAASWLARRRGVPLVTIVREAAGERIGRWLERLALDASTEVAVTEEGLGSAVLSAGIDPAHLHLLPAWTRVPAATESRAAARARLGWGAHRFTVVHAGPMDHRQDLATVVDAARLLAVSTDDDAGEDLGVVLVGEGPQRVALERQACGLGTVRFEPPPRTTAELARVLAAADVLLVTDAGASPAAGPTRLGPCLSAGRPVLAAVPESSAPAHELRRAGGAGLRVDPGDPAGLAEAVLRLRAAPHQRGVMSRAGQRYARAQLGRAAVLRRFDLVVDAALAGEQEGMTADVDRTVESQAYAGSAYAGRDR